MMLKKFFFALFTFFFTNVFSQKYIPADDPQIQYTGRISFANPKAPSFSMASSSIKIKFKGTFLEAVFSGKNFGGNGKSYVMVVVDGKANPHKRKVLTIKKGKRFYTIAENLPNKNHTLELIKVNEYWGMITFYGFRTDAKKLLPLPPKPERFIEFFGDSNASGWSVWNDKDKGGDAESGGYFIYPAFVGRALDAEIVNFSAGGHGMTPKTKKMNLTQYFDKIHIKTDDSANNQWNFKNNYIGKKPQVVVVNLGANDFYKGAQKDLFLKSWEKMVYEKIRPIYPKTHIVLVNSEGWAVGEPADYLEEVLQRFKIRGERNISYVKFPWLWGESHAVVSEQATFADILASHISEKMHWKISENADYKHYYLKPPKGNFLANPSFEKSILVRPCGWRPETLKIDAYTVFDKNKAHKGNAYLECPAKSKVYQVVFAKKGNTFSLEFYAKGKGKAFIGYAFVNQGQTELFQKIDTLKISNSWKKYVVKTQKAPQKTWKIKIILGTAAKSNAQFDDILMQKINTKN